MVALHVGWLFLFSLTHPFCCSGCPCLGRNSNCIAQGTSKNEVPCAIQILQIRAPIIWCQLAQLAPPISILIGNQDVHLPFVGLVGVFLSCIFVLLGKRQAVGVVVVSGVIIVGNVVIIIIINVVTIIVF
jgi:hypothetical protein